MAVADDERCRATTRPFGAHRARDTGLGALGQKIYLYGSRARGDYDDEPDLDFWSIVDGPVDTARQEAAWNRIYELRLELDEVATALIVSADQWTNPPYNEIPLFEEVRPEGIAA